MDLRDVVFRLRGYTPIPFLLVSILWADPSPTLIGIGLAMTILGEFTRISALRYAGGATRTRNVGAPKLVASGPYSHVRNPLYLANMLLYSGFAVGSGALLPFLPIAILLFYSWQYGMIISLEEGTLRDLFGQAYRDYGEVVPRLWPRFRSGSGDHSPPPYRLSEALREERSTIMGILVSWTILAMRLIFIPLWN